MKDCFMLLERKALRESKLEFDNVDWKISSLRPHCTLQLEVRRGDDPVNWPPSPKDLIACLLLVNIWAPLYYIDNWGEMILSFLYTVFQPMYDCGLPYLPGAGDYCLEAQGVETIERLCFHHLRFQQRYFT